MTKDLIADTRIEAYEALRAHAVKLARAILAQPASSHPQLAYFQAEALNLADLPMADPIPPNGLAAEMLEFLAENAGELFSSGGVERTKRLLIPRFGTRYWNTLMNTFPMGDYASLAAAFFFERGLEQGSCLELGAGKGNFSRLVHESIRDYLRTDKEPLLLDAGLRGETGQLDFDKPLTLSHEMNTIVAVNALHCARDKRATLRFLFDALPAGGHLLFAEGNNPVRNGEPWCLNLLFGLYEGWWDRGGFLSRAMWHSLLVQAGFTRIEEHPWAAGGYDWGGIWYARKPN